MEETLKSDLKQAQLNRDEVKVSTLRLLLSEIRNAQIQKGSDFSEEDLRQVIRREVKKRKEATEAYRGGNRQDMAEREDAERQVLEKYLPAQLSQEEVSKLVDEAMRETGASSISDMGRVIGVVMSKAQGQTDGSVISQLVKAKLSS